MQEAVAADPTLPATRSLLRRPLSFACHYGINIDNRWPNGITCPACGSDNVKERSAHPTMPHRCNSCRKFLSVKHGTAMQSSKIGYQDWAVAIHIVATGLKGTSSMKVHRDLGITQKSAWHLAHRIRQCFTDRPDLFDGPSPPTRGRNEGAKK